MSLNLFRKIESIVRNFLFLGVFLLFFTGCLPKENDVKSVFQTNAATIITKDERYIKKLIINLKTKLDKRNPQNYDKNLAAKIYTLIDKKANSSYMEINNKKLRNYKEYLELAFSKDKVKYRNDLLILGLYYQFYDAYNLKESHKVLAMQYDKKKLKNFHRNLQILKWRIKSSKDLKGDYLFLTWQNNWQIEFAKRLKENPNFSYENIKNLKYIKNKKEDVLDSSNFSFEVLLTQMIDKVSNSLISLGEEPTELTVKTLFFFI